MSAPSTNSADRMPGRVATPLSQGPAIYGLSRSTIYREWQKGNLVLIKCGRSTLIDDASARAFLARLPRLAPKR